MSTSTKTPLYLGLILLLALALRLIGIDGDGLWGDEALTVVLSEWGIRDMIWLPTDPTPFLYYALHKAFFPPEASAAVMRLISVFAGVASVALMYVLARFYFAAGGALIAALLLAVSTIHIDYSMEARAYSLAFLFTLCMSACLLGFTSSNKPSSRNLLLAGFALSCVLAFYTHISVIFWIAAANIILFVYLIKNWKTDGIRIIIAGFCMALLATPGLIRMVLQMQHGDSFGWLEQADPVRFISNQADLYLPLGFWDNAWVRAADATMKVKCTVIGIFGILIAALAWMTGRSAYRSMKIENPWRLALVAAYLIVPFIVWFTGYVSRPIYMTRAVLFCLPGFVLLITALLVQLPPRRMAVLAFCITAVFIVSTILQGFAMQKADWRGAAKLLKENAGPNDVIALCPHYAFPALRHAMNAPMPAPFAAFRKDGAFLSMDDKEEWSRHYYEDVLTGEYKENLTAEKQKPEYSQGTVRTGAGGKIWAISICKDKADEDFHAALPAKGLNAEKIWADDLDEIKIETYGVRGGAAIPVLLPSTETVQ